MEAFLEILMQLLLEIFGQTLLQIGAELGLASVKAAFERPARNPFSAAAGYLLLGSALGALSLLIRRERLFAPGPVPGLSLIISPLCVGLVMRFWGRHRRSRGHVTSHLATFGGGAAFALGSAGVRYLWSC